MYFSLPWLPVCSFAGRQMKGDNIEGWSNSLTVFAQIIPRAAPSASMADYTPARWQQGAKNARLKDN